MDQKPLRVVALRARVDRTDGLTEFPHVIAKEKAEDGILDFGSADGEDSSAFMERIVA